MAIELHIQTIKGKLKNDDPATAWKIDCEEFTYRELNQFYLHLKHAVRHVEQIIDEEINEDNEE